MALFHVSPCVSCSWAATMRNPSELVSCGRRVCDRIASHALDVPLPFVSCLRFRLDSETGVYNKLDTCGGRWTCVCCVPQAAVRPHVTRQASPVLHCWSSTSSDRSEQCEAAPKLKHYQCAAFLNAQVPHCRVELQ